MAGQVVCSSSSRLWSFTASPQQRPSAVVLQSICTLPPLTSIAVAPPAPPPPSQHVQQPAAGPFRAFEAVVGTNRHQRRQQQQQLEQLAQAADDAVQQSNVCHQQKGLQQAALLDQQDQQQQQQQEDGAAALEQLVAAAKWRLQLGTPQLQLLLQQVQPLLPRLQPHQLAQAAHAVSVLPHGPAAAAGVPGWQEDLLAAAGPLFYAGRMNEWASSVLLQALVPLGAQPGPAWMQAACAGMRVGTFQSSRALATVAAVLPQLGHVPNSSWAGAFFRATARKLHDLPAVSLARMLHGVVAWRHLQQQQQLQQHAAQQPYQQQQGQQQELVLPEQWLLGVLQQLHARSSELKPCELAMVLQSITRLQQPGCLCHDSDNKGTGGSSSSSSRGRSRSRGSQVVGSAAWAQQPTDSRLQVCSQQLLHVLLPAVPQQQQHFGSQDFAVVLHSLALLLQQVQQGGGAGGVAGVAQQLCSWEWLQQVLPAVQGRLAEANPRTQVTSLWAAAVLVQPHLQLQAQQQQHQQLHQQQLLRLEQQQVGVEQSAAAPAGPQQPQQQQQQPPRAPPGLVRPVWQGSRQQAQQPQAQQQLPPQAAAAVAAAQAAAAVLHTPPVAYPAGGSHQGPASRSLASALDALTALPTATEAAAATAASAGALPPPPAAAAVPDAAGVWLSWLDDFYSASLPHLATFSGEDLTVAAATLATQQQVPPVLWYEQLLAAVHQQLPSMTPGQVAGVAWALGRMALLPCRHNPGASLVPLQPWLDALYAHAGLRQGGSSPGAVTAAAAGAAAAAAEGTGVQQQEEGGLGAGRLQGRGGSGQGVTAAEVVRLMWAAAVCDYDPGDAWWAAAEQTLLSPGSADGSGSSSSGSTPQSAMPPTQLAAQFESQQQQPQAAVSLLPTRLQGALLQAYAASGRQLPPQLLHALLTPAVAQQLCAEPLVNTLRLLRGLARTGSRVQQQQQQWLVGLAGGLQGRLAGLTLQELAQLLLCLADAGLQGQDMVSSQSLQEPSSSSSSRGGGGSNSSSSSNSSDGCGELHSWVGAVSQAVRARLSAGTASPSDVAQLLWGAAKLRLQLPPDLVQVLLQQMRVGFLAASPTSLAVGIDAISRLGVVPSRDWLGSFLMATHRSFTAAAAAAAGAAGSTSSSSSSTSSSGDSFGQGGSSSIGARQALVAAILQTLQGLSRLRGAAAAPLPPKWLKQQLLLLHGQLPLLRPRHTATLLLLLARLKCRPSPAYLNSMLGQLGDCSSCSALDLVHIAYGIAALRWRPNRQWMRLFLAASAQQMPAMSHQGVALLHWALGVTRVTPPRTTWRAVAVEVVAARLGQLDALQLSMIVWAWGRMQVHLTPLARPQGVAAAPELQIHQRGLQQQQQVLVAAGQRLAAQRASGEGEDSSTSAVSSPAGAGAAGAAAQLLLSRYWQPRREVAQQLLAAALQLRGEYSASQLCHLLVGLAKMRVRPSQAWLHAMVMQASRQPLSALDGYQMQQLLWALARMQYRAPAAWVEGVGLLLETKWQQQAATRHSAEWAMHQLRMLAVAPPGVTADSSL